MRHKYFSRTSQRENKEPNTQKDAAALTKSSEEMVISGMIMTSAAVVVVVVEEAAAEAAKSHMSRHQKVNTNQRTNKNKRNRRFFSPQIVDDSFAVRRDDNSLTIIKLYTGNIQS